MENPNNAWFQANKRKIEVLKRQLLEYDYSGSYGGSINLMQIIQFLDGSILEIVKMDKLLAEKDREINTLKKEVESLKPKTDDKK